MNNIIPPQWPEKYSKYLLAYALEQMSDRPKAEVLVNETFLLAAASQATFSSENAERKWLTAILKNKIADTIAKNS